MLRLVYTFGLALPLALSVTAQAAAIQSPPDLRGTLGHEEKAPVPRDRYGNPIPPQQPTEAEREAARREQAARAAQIRAEEQAREIAEQRAVEERRAAERLAEETRFHERVMTAIYLGLAMLAVFGIASFIKRNK